MLLEFVPEAAIRGIPDPDAGVASSAQERGSVGKEGHLQIARRMGLPGAQMSCRRTVPDANQAVLAAGVQTGPVLRKTERRDPEVTTERLPDRESGPRVAKSYASVVARGSDAPSVRSDSVSQSRNRFVRAPAAVRLPSGETATE
jgi:hypothetical protein